jgi:hypothetical protein
MQLWDEYNEVERVTPDLDQRFAALARERITRSPLRYYLWLPAARMADMWFRPRTEKLPADSRWWEFNDDPKWSVLAVALGLINLAYLTTALITLLRRTPILYLGLLLTFVMVRSMFLSTLENPEPRYTLECYPVVIILAAGLASGKSKRLQKT